MDLGRAFGFVFDDQEWVTKILITALISLIPFVGQIALYGYMVETARNVAAGNPRPLPDWSNFGDKLLRGLWMLVISLVYALPVGVVTGLFACVMVLLVGNGRQDAQPIILVGICFGPLIVILSLAVAVVSYVALVRYVQTDSLNAAFDVRAVLALLRAQPGLAAMLILTLILAGLVGILGVIACGLGVLVTLAYAYAVMGHALGQAAVRMR